MMTTAAARPSRPSTARSLIDCSMYGAWSNTTVNLVSWPSDFSRAGMSARTALDTATVLPSEVLVTEMVSAGLPLTREIPVVGSFTSATFATLDSGASMDVVDSVAPSGVRVTVVLLPISGRSRSCLTEVSWLPACTTRVLPCSVMSPEASRLPFCWRAVWMFCTVKPCALNSESSGGDADPLAQGPEQGGLAHAVERLDVVDGRAVQGVGEVVRVQIAGHREREDGDVGQAFGHDLRIDPARERQPVDGELDLLLDIGDIRSVLEGRRHRRRARRRRRRGRIDAVDGLDGGLDRSADVVVDDRGRRPDVRAHDRQLRSRDGREQLLLEGRERDRPEHSDHDGDEGDESAVAQTEDRQQMHESSIPAGSWALRTPQGGAFWSRGGESRFAVGREWTAIVA